MHCVGYVAMSTSPSFLRRSAVCSQVLRPILHPRGTLRTFLRRAPNQGTQTGPSAGQYIPALSSAAFFLAPTFLGAARVT